MNNNIPKSYGDCSHHNDPAYFKNIGYGGSYNDSFGYGCREGYGSGYFSGDGDGNGRARDYDSAGYGCVNKDDCEVWEDGHGNGGLYMFAEGYCYYAHNDFQSYGQRD